MGVSVGVFLWRKSAAICEFSPSLCRGDNLKFDVFVIRRYVGGKVHKCGIQYPNEFEICRYVYRHVILCFHWGA